MDKSILCLLAFVLVVFAARAEQPPVKKTARLVGVVGFRESEIQDDHFISASSPCLVPLFSYEAGKWVKADLKSKSNWFIFLDGHQQMPIAAGEVQKACLAFGSGNAGVLDLLKKRTLLGLNLMATDDLRATDSDKWKRFKPTSQDENRVKKAFIDRFETERKCLPDKPEPGWSEIQDTGKKLTPQSLVLETRAFQSKAGNSVIGVAVKGEACRDDAYEIDSYYQKHWFFWDGKLLREIIGYDRRLSIEPIEAGDFDGDGKSEWVFRLNGSGAGDMGGTEFALLNSEMEVLVQAASPLPGSKDEGWR